MNILDEKEFHQGISVTPSLTFLFFFMRFQLIFFVKVRVNKQTIVFIDLVMSCLHT
jgi:hypothetical protein